MLCDTAELEKEKVLLEEELTRVLDAIQSLISENARIVQDQAEYQKRYTALSEKHEILKTRYDEVVTQIKGRYLKSVRLDEFITEFRKSGKAIKEFDESLFGFMVEYVTVGRNKEFIFTFRDGTEITIQ